MSTHPTRIVAKFGSGILANARGTALDGRQFARLDFGTGDHRFHVDLAVPCW